jgi:hypothetical protein
MARARKPLHEDCTGSVNCAVEGHVVHTQYLNGKSRTLHIRLTAGQTRTLHERRAAALRAGVEPNLSRKRR